MQKGIRCTINLVVKQASCPGVWLYDGKVFLVIYIYGRRIYSTEIPPLFPLRFNQKFTFSKIYINCYNFHDVCKAQFDESIIIELRQREPRSTTCNLATYENKLNDFLFPAPHLMPSYSGAAREILLRPTLRFPGIIGPKLEFSTHTSFDEIMECDCHCSDIHRVHCESDIYQRGRRSRRLNTFSEQYESADKSWNEPPFVVRKVDDNLLSRSPSLFQSGKMCSYCCKSPHRHSNCAACRFKRIQSPSPIRLKPNRNRSYVKQDNYCTYCKHAERHLKSDCKLCETQSDNPKIVPNVAQESPIPNSPKVESKSVDRTRLSSNTSTVHGNGSPDVARLKSPIFDRPSYLERYGTSPVNPSGNRNTNMAESDETFVEVRQNDKVKEDHLSCHNCWCHSHLGHLSSPQLNCCYNCRFGSPYNFYNWRAFHHGLTRVYDDLYKEYM